MQVFVWFLWVVKSCVGHLKPDIDYMAYEQGEINSSLIHYKDSAATCNDTTALPGLRISGTVDHGF